MSADILIHVENLKKHYHGHDIRALDGVSADIAMTICDGEIVYANLAEQEEV